MRTVLSLTWHPGSADQVFLAGIQKSRGNELTCDQWLSPSSHLPKSLGESVSTLQSGTALSHHKCMSLTEMSLAQNISAFRTYGPAKGGT